RQGYRHAADHNARDGGDIECLSELLMGGWLLLVQGSSVQNAGVDAVLRAPGEGRFKGLSHILCRQHQLAREIPTGADTCCLFNLSNQLGIAAEGDQAHLRQTTPTRCWWGNDAGRGPRGFASKLSTFKQQDPGTLLRQ